MRFCVSFFEGTNLGGFTGSFGRLARGLEGNWRETFVCSGVTPGTGLTFLSTGLYDRTCHTVVSPEFRSLGSCGSQVITLSHARLGNPMIRLKLLINAHLSCAMNCGKSLIMCGSTGIVRFHVCKIVKGNEIDKRFKIHLTSHRTRFYVVTLTRQPK